MLIIQDRKIIAIDKNKNNEYVYYDGYSWTVFTPTAIELKGVE